MALLQTDVAALELGTPTTFRSYYECTVKSKIQVECREAREFSCVYSGETESLDRVGPNLGMQEVLVCFCNFVKFIVVISSLESTIP